MRDTLRQRDFRLLWLGQSASTLGDRLIVVALAIYVTDLAGPTALGLVLAAQIVPYVGLMLFGGVWADRLPRQRVMLATDVGRCALHAALAVLIFTGAIAVWQLIVAEFLYGSLKAFFRPAYSGLLPQTVPEDMIQSAQAVTSLTTTVANILGPALGTAIVLAAGAGWAFALDAATYALSAAFLVRLSPRERGERAARTSTWVELREGWSAFVANTWVWALVVAASVGVLFVLGPFETLGPRIAEHRYGSAGYYGAILTLFGIGTALGSVIGGRVRLRHRIRISHLLVMPHGAFVVAYALGAPLGLVGAAFALSGIASGFFVVWWETAIVEEIPPHLLSRVSAYNGFGATSFLPLGYALAGPAAAAFGTTTVLVTGAVVMLLVDTAVLRAVWQH